MSSKVKAFVIILVSVVLVAIIVFLGMYLYKMYSTDSQEYIDNSSSITSEQESISIPTLAFNLDKQNDSHISYTFDSSINTITAEDDSIESYDYKNVFIMIDEERNTLAIKKTASWNDFSDTIYELSLADATYDDAVTFILTYVPEYFNSIPDDIGTNVDMGGTYYDVTVDEDGNVSYTPIS